MLNQPVSQIKLTNIAIIKYKISGKIFQIACYRNKAINWRNGVEEDLDEVLQYQEIYTNVSKGEIAAQKDLFKYFQLTDKNQIIKIILEKGDLQITDKERESQLEFMFKEMVNFLASKCVDSISKKHIPLHQIEQIVKESHFKVSMDQSAKKQGLQCLKRLQKKYQIMRAQMMVRVDNNKEGEEQNMMARLEKLMGEEKISWKQVRREIDDDGQYGLIDSHQFRQLDNLVKQVGMELEIIDNVYANRDKTDLDSGTAQLQVRKDWNGDWSDDDHQVTDVLVKQQQYTKNKGKKGKKDKDKDKDSWIIQEQIDKSATGCDNQGIQQYEIKSKKKGRLAQLKQDEKEQITKKTNKKKKKKDRNDGKDDDDNHDDNQDQQYNQQLGCQSDHQQTKQFVCSTCKSASFSDNSEFRQHFKSKWHLHNLNMKRNNKGVLDLEEYQDYEFESQK